MGQNQTSYCFLETSDTYPQLDEDCCRVFRLLMSMKNLHHDKVHKKIHDSELWGQLSPKLSWLDSEIL